MTEILADQYIVVLIDSSKNNCWKNYCFKQYKDSYDICPESTPKEPENSSSHAESYSPMDEWWRFATDEEIARYDIEGFFKITSKPKKSRQPVIVEINNYQVW
jgi:hypothetical protein